jgi:signal transduction histidine kinase
MADWIAARLHSRVARYGTSLVALALASALTLAIVHCKLPRQINFYAFLLVIIGSAWWGGYGPGLITASATLLLGPYLTQAAYTIRHPHLANAPMVIIISVLISRMAGARQKLREANELLDERVRRRTAELERVNGFLREREAQLVAQAERLSESNADLEQFAYFASHDLQEPLRMIAIYAELLEERQGSQFDAESTKYVRMVRDSVRRLELLVDDLLMYSRAIHNDVGEGLIETEAREALVVAKNNLKAQIERVGALITTGELPTLTANPVHLVQIFQNLIGNSLKYRGADPPRIAVGAIKRENAWIFSVKDNGIGTSPDYHETIFIPFNRLHGQQYPGSGVGLAICRRIIERLGRTDLGRIRTRPRINIFLFSAGRRVRKRTDRSTDIRRSLKLLRCRPAFRSRRGNQRLRQAC